MSAVPLFWQRCLDAFREELTPQQFNTWIRPLALESAGGGYRLLAPNRFVLQWVKERFLARITELAARAEGRPVPITLAITESPPEAARADAGTAPPPPQPPGEGAPSPKPPSGMTTPPALPRRHEQTSLNPGFTFATFVAGKANQLARAAGMQVAEHPTSYNPLFVYGGVGLGKTHLDPGDRQPHPAARSRRAKIRYIHAETYVSDVVRAYQHKAFDDFKRYYRSLDLLLIDDIQFFGGKSRTQEEFFYLFNTLIEAHKQVVITCDTYPKEISGIEERLISRFGWGLTVALEPPELEMRVAILLAKAAATGLTLDEQVAFFIAKHIRSNVRELEGALKRVVAYSSFHGQEITLARGQGSAARSSRRAEPPDLDREHPEDGRRLLQDPHLGHALEEALARDRPAAAGRDGAREGAHPAVAAGDRQQFRRPRPHDGAARLPPDRQAARVRSPSSITTSISCCRCCGAEARPNASGPPASHSAFPATFCTG